MLGIAFALAMALSWAGAGIVLRSLPIDLDVFLVNGLRALFGLLALAVIVVATGAVGHFQSLTGSQILYLVASMLVAGVLGDALYISSLRLLGMTRCFPIISSYPLFTVLLSALLLGEHIRWPMVVGMFVVFVGVGLVGRPERGTDEGSDATTHSGHALRGVFMALAASILYAAEGILISLGAQEVPPMVANSVRMPVVVVVSLLIAGQRRHWGQIRCRDRRTLGLLCLAGFLAGTVAGSLWVAAVRFAGPSRAAIVGSVAPLFAVPLSVVLLHERPTRLTLAGTVLTVIGIILVV